MIGLELTLDGARALLTAVSARVRHQVGGSDWQMLLLIEKRLTEEIIREENSPERVPIAEEKVAGNYERGSGV